VYSARTHADLAAFAHLPYIHGTTGTGAALQQLINSVLHINNRPNYQDVVIVITDGESDDNPFPPADDLRRMVCARARE
jgi:uncharacterized protein YegL